MTDSTFRALAITESPEKTFKRIIEARRISDLPEGEVLVRVRLSENARHLCNRLLRERQRRIQKAPCARRSGSVPWTR